MQAVAEPAGRPLRQPSYDKMAKLLVIGDAGIGKTSLVSALCGDRASAAKTAPPKTVPTLGVDFRIAHLDTHGSKWKCHVWDATGQSRYASIRTAYHRVVQGVIIAYDSTNAESFEHIREWLDEVRRYAPAGARAILVATKIDLEAQCEVPAERARALADSLGLPFVETSALRAPSVLRAFEAIVGEVEAAPAVTLPTSARRDGGGIGTGASSAARCWPSADSNIFSCCCVGLRLLPWHCRNAWERGGGVEFQPFGTPLVSKPQMSSAFAPFVTSRHASQEQVV